MGEDIPYSPQLVLGSEISCICYTLLYEEFTPFLNHMFD